MKTLVKSKQLTQLRISSYTDFRNIFTAVKVRSTVVRSLQCRLHRNKCSTKISLRTEAEPGLHLDKSQVPDCPLSNIKMNMLRCFYYNLVFTPKTCSNRWDKKTFQVWAGVQDSVTVVTELAQLHPQSLLWLSVDGVNTDSFFPQ